MKQDQEFEDGRMNNIPFPCGKFASSLRKQLFHEHLGLINIKDINIDDIIIKSFYEDVWCARSKQNTKIYEEVFQCIPTDKVVNFAMLKQYQDEESISLSNPLLAQEMVEGIKVSFFLNRI
jgi:phospholipase D1/2